MYTTYSPNSYLLSYQSTYRRPISTELVAKVKPNINWVEVHSQLSNIGQPMDGVLVGAGLPWLTFKARA